MNDYNFGNFVCRLREERGLTQAQIASQLGVTVAAVSKWENGTSKPRVNILFALAQILGVTPEELMAGHRIDGETPDPDAIRELNARYEYLRRIELYNDAGTKIRRIIAWVLDWNIIGLFDLILLGLVAALVPTGADSTLSTVAMLGIMLLYPVLFILRDFLLCGRSIGKRICGLVVLNKQTGCNAMRYQLILRSLLFFLVYIDGVVMIASGRSIGDQLANTVVVSKKDIENTTKTEPLEEMVNTINQYPTKQTENARKNKRTAIILICAGAVALAILIGGIFAITLGVLKNETETDEYKMAYSYLIESDELERLGVDPDKIRLNSVDSVVTTSSGIKRIKKTYGFSTGGLRKVYVVCHDDGDGWYVCADCTGF